MTNSELYAHVDHTQLKAFATWEDIKKLCDEAVKYKTASVCVPPCYIKRIHDTYGDRINICTVIGFPLGYSVTKAKVTEAVCAIEDGASEVDMVININDAKNGDFDKILNEIKEIKNACGDHILKVIIETCYLTDEEKIRLCKVVTEAGADYIKTSTGFGTGGATFEDVKLFKENIGPDVKIKAAGGIRTRDDMERFMELGADRLGTSSAISILEG
ncbi:MAG: deoxyribose-phosphate aldolase [Lachnospiraceae bacterium]|nr:deoxyribose-phosphate aldolase [Lachnospiraceae bacterium]MBO7599882.1 deoxyribose-phosphate aldolase [Lachnospiraceae bacterium]